MAIATFGSKVFTASHNKVYTFNDFTRSGGLNIEEQDVNGKKPSTYIKGIGLEDISFNVQLIEQKKLSVKGEIDSWFKIKDDKKPYLLIIGGKAVNKNKYLLVNVTVQDSSFSTAGKCIKATLQLQFKEYVRAGKNTSSSSGSSSSKNKSKSSSKSSKKRSNKNASNAVAKGKMNKLEKEIFG
jgi:phage protein U